MLEIKLVHIIYMKAIIGLAYVMSEQNVPEFQWAAKKYFI